MRASGYLPWMRLHTILCTLAPVLFASQAAAEVTEVSISTSDGIEVKGSFELPDGDIFDPIPAVLLVHGGRQSRAEWAPLLPELSESGWAVLSIDLRGHGATGGEIKDWNAFYTAANGVPRDLEAAMAFLKAHESVNADRIAVVGSSVGGNLACVAVQKYGAIGGVFISGKTEAATSLAGETLTNLKSMLYIAGEKEQNGERAGYARELAGMSAGASRALIVPGSSTHGATLLREKPDLVHDIMDHLGGVLANGKFKEIEFPSADGLTITAEMYGPHGLSAPWIVVCHQAGWSRGEYRETAPRLTALGFNVLALDQRSGGAINEVTNKTAARAKEKDLPTAYLDAEVDIVAGLQWVQEFGAKKVVLVGSSYSSSLALKIAAEHPELVHAVASFSPGEYFGKDRPKLIEAASAKVACPTFITSAKKEVASWQPFFDAIPGAEGEAKWSHTPEVDGQHGSRALWSQFEGHRELWAAFTGFLLLQR